MRRTGVRSYIFIDGQPRSEIAQRVVVIEDHRAPRRQPRQHELARVLGADVDIGIDVRERELELLDLWLGEGSREAVCTTTCGDGATTWHAFAEQILDEGRRHRALRCTRIDPFTTADYPTPARRPAYSVLGTERLRALGIASPSWRSGLARVVAHILTAKERRRNGEGTEK